MKITLTCIMISLLFLHGIVGSPSTAYGDFTGGSQTPIPGQRTSVTSEKPAIVQAYRNTLPPCRAGDVALSFEAAELLVGETLKKEMSLEEREGALEMFRADSEMAKLGQCILSETPEGLSNAIFNSTFRELLEEFAVMDLTNFGSNLPLLRKVGLRAQSKCKFLTEREVRENPVFKDAGARSARCCYVELCGATQSGAAQKQAL